MDKYSAVWVSHSSLSDFIACPRAYYLKNVYKDPNTGHKIQIVGPSLSLGQAVHEVLEALSVLPTNQRFTHSLVQSFDTVWKKVSGKRGGFTSPEQEAIYKNRGEAMIRRVMANPGPIAQLSVKIKEDLPYFWLSESDGIILCGKIDWLAYHPDTDSVTIVDFKTSKQEEDSKSLQLPIYCLLVHHCQRRTVDGAAYWYLEFSDELQAKPLPNLDDARDTVLTLAKQVVLARKLGRFVCPEGAHGCRACRPFERILAGEGEFLGTQDRRDLYFVGQAKDMPESEIL